VAGRTEDNASLAERARTIADQDQKLRHFQAQADCLLAERTQQVAQLEQEDTQKDRLVERLRDMLSDVAEQVQGSLNGDQKLLGYERSRKTDKMASSRFALDLWAMRRCENTHAVAAIWN
jgi:hypothetical protein